MTRPLEPPERGQTWLLQLQLGLELRVLTPELFDLRLLPIRHQRVGVKHLLPGRARELVQQEEGVAELVPGVEGRVT